MSRQTVYRTLSVRHTAVPRRSSAARPTMGFAGMLAKLGLASEKLEKARRRR